MTNEVIIVGGGASGLFSAITLAKRKKQVVVVEANDRPGKKILQTGNGRCNLSNLYMNSSMYHCADAGFIQEALTQYSVEDVIQEFEQMGVMIKRPQILPKTEEEARYSGIYPYSNQAATIRDALYSYCHLLGVTFLCHAKVTRIEQKEEEFVLTYQDTSIEETVPKEKTISGRKVVITVGSKAGIVKDDTALILESIRRLGHTVYEYKPSLCSLYAGKNKKKFFKGVNGVRSEGSVRLLIDDVCMQEAKGEVQFCDYGLSGIVIFQISSLVARMSDKKCEVELDLLPDFSEEDVMQRLKSQQFYEKKTAIDLFSGILNKKLVTGILNEYATNHQEVSGSSKQLKDDALHLLIHYMKHMRIPITKTNDAIHSQVCSGGVSVFEIHSKTMESKKISGLYFAGECIDVDGLCGGYNLQWAWTSGVIAGRNI